MTDNIYILGLVFGFITAPFIVLPFLRNERDRALIEKSAARTELRIKYKNRELTRQEAMSTVWWWPGDEDLKWKDE